MFYCPASCFLKLLVLLKILVFINILDLIKIVALISEKLALSILYSSNLLLAKLSLGFQITSVFVLEAVIKLLFYARIKVAFTASNCSKLLKY